MIKRIFFCAAIILSGTAFAESSWNNSITAQSLFGEYSGSVKRDSIVSGGVIFSGDYLDSGGITIGINHSNVKFNLGYGDISQNSLYLSGRYNIFSDSISGKVILRSDLHYIDNDDPTQDTDQVKAFAPQATYVPYSGAYAINFGFAYSSFQNNLSVYQYTPGFGFGFNDKKDWLSVGAYLIYPDNTLRSQGRLTTRAIELNLTHWLTGERILPISFLTANVMLGERIYAVDNNAGAVYNLANVQKSSFSVGSSWDLGNSYSMMTIIGQENFEDVDISNSYSNRYLYFNLSKSW
ncbi:MAG: hypothetical protein D6B27_08085 [Gammaproteobacteria bacterium]|nr:MAG: hypothetical protein D6B27_08085 [Gammaproteobacteria bacterium]